MTSRRTTTIVPHSTAEMFELVADVEKYPEFVPHCVALRILSREIEGGQGVLTAEMIVAYGAFRESFKSLVRLDRPRMEIEASYVDGPFRRLHNLWRFRDAPGGSEIDFTIDFEFRNFLLRATASAVFERAFAHMSEAFVARADAVLGAKAR